MIVFTIPGQPIGKGRPRIGKSGAHARLFTPQKTVSYEGLVAHTAQAAMAGRPMFDLPVSVNLFLACQVPASWSAKKKNAAIDGTIYPTTKPDVDNVVKAIFDGLNGVLWRDDVLVVDVRLRKRYAATPSVRVEVWALEQPLPETASWPKLEALA